MMMPTRKTENPPLRLSFVVKKHVDHVDIYFMGQVRGKAQDFVVNVHTPAEMFTDENGTWRYAPSPVSRIAIQCENVQWIRGVPEMAWPQENPVKVNITWPCRQNRFEVTATQFLPQEGALMLEGFYSKCSVRPRPSGKKKT
jgi:hypothetical protein